MKILKILLVTLVCIWPCMLYAENNKLDWLQKSDAITYMHDNNGLLIGTVHAKQATQGILLRLNLKNLPQGIHGMHFHNIGDCSDYKKFKSAGGHINSHEKPHGFLNPNGPHDGNLPNLIVAKNGTAHLELYSQMVTIKGALNSLLDKDGGSLVIHKNIDDHKSQPIGGSGARIACGVFKPFQE